MNTAMSSPWSSTMARLCAPSRVSARAPSGANRALAARWRSPICSAQPPPAAVAATVRLARRRRARRDPGALRRVEPPAVAPRPGIGSLEPRRGCAAAHGQSDSAAAASAVVGRRRGRRQQRRAALLDKAGVELRRRRNPGRPTSRARNPRLVATPSTAGLGQRPAQPPRRRRAGPSPQAMILAIIGS